MSEPLKPCPLCGGESLLIHDTNTDYERQWKYRVDCRSLDCEINGPERKTADEAIAAWNRRASPWRNFATDRPADGEDCFIVYAWRKVELWIMERGKYYSEDQVFNVDQKGEDLFRPADALYCLWQPLPAPPTPEEIERAKRVEPPSSS